MANHFFYLKTLGSIVPRRDSRTPPCWSVVLREVDGTWSFSTLIVAVLLKLWKPSENNYIPLSSWIQQSSCHGASGRREMAMPWIWKDSNLTLWQMQLNQSFSKNLLLRSKIKELALCCLTEQRRILFSQFDFWTSLSCFIFFWVLMSLFLVQL